MAMLLRVSDLLLGIVLCMLRTYSGNKRSKKKKNLVKGLLLWLKGHKVTENQKVIALHLKDFSLELIKFLSAECLMFFGKMLDNFLQQN